MIFDIPAVLLFGAASALAVKTKSAGGGAAIVLFLFGFYRRHLTRKMRDDLVEEVKKLEKQRDGGRPNSRAKRGRLRSGSGTGLRTGHRSDHGVGAGDLREHAGEHVPDAMLKDVARKIAEAIWGASETPAVDKNQDNEG